MRRRFADRAVTALAWLAGATACLVLVGLVAAVLERGLPALSPAFLLEPTRDAGAAGGVLWQLVGTLLLGATALVFCLPLATGLALAGGVYLPGGAARRRLRLALYVWNGIPSIVLGIAGMLVFASLLGWGKSWLAGGLVLGWMMLPTVTLARLARIEAIPARRLEAAAALGLPRGQIVRSVVLPASRGGLYTGALLGVARALGETAPILFTAAVFAGATLPRGVRESPVLALPYHIYVLAQDSFEPAAMERLWGAAAVLLTLVLVASLLALPARLRAEGEARGA